MERIRAWCFLIEGGQEVEPRHDLFLVFDEERAVSGALGVDWRPGGAVTVSGRYRHAWRTSEIYESEAITDALTISVATSGGDRWTAHASYALQDFDLFARTTMLFLTPLPNQLPAVATYEGTQHVGTVAVSDAVTPFFRPTLTANAVVVGGDGAIQYYGATTDLPWSLHDGLTIGLELDARHFDPADVPIATDHTSIVAMAYARVEV